MSGKIQQPFVVLFIGVHGRLHGRFDLGVGVHLVDVGVVLGLGPSGVFGLQTFPAVGHSVGTLSGNQHGQHGFGFGRVHAPGLGRTLNIGTHIHKVGAGSRLVTIFRGITNLVRDNAHRAVRDELARGLGHFVGHAHEILGVERLGRRQFASAFGLDDALISGGKAVNVLHAAGQTKQVATQSCQFAGFVANNGRSRRGFTAEDRSHFLLARHDFSRRQVNLLDQCAGLVADLLNRLGAPQTGDGVPQAHVPRLFVQSGAEFDVGLQLRNKFFGVGDTVLFGQIAALFGFLVDCDDLSLGVALLGRQVCVRGTHHPHGHSVDGLVDDVFIADNGLRIKEHRVLTGTIQRRHALDFAGLGVGNGQVVHHANFGAPHQTADVLGGLLKQGVLAVRRQTFNGVKKTTVADCVLDVSAGLGAGSRGVLHGHVAFVFNSGALGVGRRGFCALTFGFGQCIVNRFFSLRLGRGAQLHLGGDVGLSGFQRPFSTLLGFNRHIQCIPRQFFGGGGLGFFEVCLGFGHVGSGGTDTLTGGNHSGGTGQFDQVFAFFYLGVNLFFGHAVSSGLVRGFEIGLALAGGGIQLLFKHRQTDRVGVIPAQIRCGQACSSRLCRTIAFGDCLTRLCGARQHLTWRLGTGFDHRPNTAARQAGAGFNRGFSTLNGTVFSAFTHRGDDTFAQLHDALIRGFKALNGGGQFLDFRHVVCRLCLLQFCFAQVEFIAHSLAGLGSQRRCGVGLKAGAGQTQTFANALQCRTLFGGVCELRQLVFWLFGGFFPFFDAGFGQHLFGLLELGGGLCVFFSLGLQLRSQLLNLVDFGIDDGFDVVAVGTSQPQLLQTGFLVGKLFCLNFRRRLVICIKQQVVGPQFVTACPIRHPHFGLGLDFARLKRQQSRLALQSTIEFRQRSVSVSGCGLLLQFFNLLKRAVTHFSEQSLGGFYFLLCKIQFLRRNHGVVIFFFYKSVERCCPCVLVFTLFFFKIVNQGVDVFDLLIRS